MLRVDRTRRRWRLWFPAWLAALVLTVCEYTEVAHEVGYKGRARIGPWLAADCEVCCRPMVIVFTGDDVYARGPAE